MPALDIIPSINVQVHCRPKARSPTLSQTSESRHDNGWLPEEEAQRFGEDTLFVEDIVDLEAGTDTDEEPLAKKVQKLKNNPPKKKPEPVVEESETEESDREKSKSEESGEDASAEEEEVAKFGEESSDQESEGTPALPQAIDSTPEADQVEANTDITPDEEHLANTTSLSSAVQTKRKVTFGPNSSEPATKKRVISSDEESPEQFAFETQHTDEDTEVSLTKSSASLMISSLTETGEVMKCLEEESKSLGILITSPGGYTRMLSEVMGGWKKELTVQREVTALCRELGSTRQELDALKKSSAASTKSQRKELKEAKAEAKRTRKKKRSTHKKLHSCRAELEAKISELEDTESRTKTSDTKVKIQQRVFVMKFGEVIASATQTHTFDEVKNILEAAKTQPEAQTERHARYRRIAERALANYQALASTLDVKLDELSFGVSRSRMDEEN
ncbi:hypothetical protein R1sor_006875 [Riccia sorocarpa]|uniref:Uncharacterized protein n=1 Tax=Riccia sorocarpa TaxID=122646 RepID=A0ABD3HSB3_9MARC